MTPLGVLSLSMTQIRLQWGLWTRRMRTTATTVVRMGLVVQTLLMRLMRTKVTTM
jgi:hypothetical protein